MQTAIDASYTFPDHTYVHVVDEFGRLQGVFISIHGRLTRIRLENEVGNRICTGPMTFFASLVCTAGTRPIVPNSIVHTETGKHRIDLTVRNRGTILEMHPDSPMFNSKYREQIDLCGNAYRSLPLASSFCHRSWCTENVPSKTARCALLETVWVRWFMWTRRRTSTTERLLSSLHVYQYSMVIEFIRWRLCLRQDGQYACQLPCYSFPSCSDESSRNKHCSIASMTCSIKEYPRVKSWMSQV